jgi:cob(I)alamin adenosyltransferase
VKIYTRKGDSGETSLFGGRRVPKDDVRVEAYGDVDELNSALGLAVALLPARLEEWRSRLVRIQSDCFTIGAILATPKAADARPGHIPGLAETRVGELEAAIDELDEELEALHAFVLPGGSESAAALHLARSICRRAERAVVTLARSEAVEPVVLEYLNRLSDLLFMLARAANARQGVADVEWHPESER